jgi:hypothetical protein
MWCNRFVLVVATLSVALSTVAHSQRADLEPSCIFPEVQDVITPMVVGADSITKRLQVVQPLDAPVRILRADFTGATLTTGGFFRFTHNYSLDVINITDQFATVIDPAAYAFSKGDAAGQHAGGGIHPARWLRLGPGERGVLRGNGGITEGSLQVDDDVHIRVGIVSVKFDSCTWKNFRRLFPFGPSKSTQPDRLDGSFNVLR